MAIDQTPSTSSADSTPIQVIENEFPTYRAISSAAVFSMILGIASVFVYADLWFLLVVAASILVGLQALRKIHQLPDVLTGAAYARIGIGLALLFGLTSVTRTVVEEVMVNLDASRFAKLYVGIIKDEPVNVALWYQQSPEYRKSKSPDEIVEEMKKTRSPGGDPYLERSAGIQKMKDRLKGQGEAIHFSKIESKAIDGLTTYANALIELDGPGSKDFPEKEQFALVQMIKRPDAGPHDWMVQEVKFPYTPASTVATVQKKDDDGHGHNH